MVWLYVLKFYIIMVIKIKYISVKFERQYAVEVTPLFAIELLVFMV